MDYIYDKYIGNAISKSDTEVFEALFHSLYEKLCKYAYTFIPDRDECEDTVQQCFMRLWDNREKAADILSFKSYMYRAVYNASLNKIQHKKVTDEYSLNALAELESIYYADFDNTVPNDRFEKIIQALNLLPEKNKEVFTLRFIEGLSTKAVSEKLNITVRTVETHVSKALKFLRKQLEVTLLVTISIIIKNLFWDTWF